MTFEAGYYEAHHPRVGRVIFYATLSVIEGAAFAKAAANPDERWVTLKPHGPDHPDYLHVKIRQHPDGTASIVTGPGELRGLRLSKLGAGRKERKQAAKDARKERLAGLTDTQKAERKQREKDLKDRLASATQTATRLARAFAPEFVGPSPDDDKPDTPAAATHQTLTSLERATITHLANDSALRDAILTGDVNVPAEDVPGARPTGTPKRGYQYDAEREAAKHGATRVDARKDDDEFFRKRIDAVLESDPERAARMIEAREAMLAKRDEPKPPLPQPPQVKPAALLEEAQKAREYLSAMRDLRILKRELRLHTLALDPEHTPEELEALTSASKPPTGAPWDVHHESLDPKFAADLERQVRDAGAEDLTRAFLDAAAADPELGWGYDRMQAAMRAPHGAGAYAHLNNLSLATYGHEVIDRTVVDALGVTAAAKLLARHLTQNVPADQRDALRDGLARYHDENSVTRMRTAMEQAQEARAGAASMNIPNIEAGVDAVAARRLIRDKRRMLEDAHKALGNALGEVEAGAAMNFALMRKPSDNLLVNLGGTEVERASLNLRALGLGDGQYEYHRDADGNLWASITSEGMDALTQPADASEKELVDHLNRIKDGEFDEPDWLPAGFTRYPKSAFDQNPPMPEAFASNPLAGDGPVADRFREAVATRLADGWNPAEVRRHLTSESVQMNLSPAERADAEAAINDLMPLLTGKKITVQQENPLTKAVEKIEVDEAYDYGRLEEKHPEQYARLQALASDWIKQHRPEDAAYADQHLDDTPDARRALYMAVLEDPTTQVAFKPTGDLTRKDQRAIRTYFTNGILGLSPEEMAVRQDSVGAAIEKWESATDADGNPLRPMPDKFVGAFGRAANPHVTIRVDTPSREAEAKELARLGLTQEGTHYVRNNDGTLTLTDEGKRAVKPPPILKGPNGQPLTSKELREREARHGSRPAVLGLDELNPEYREWFTERSRVAAEAFNPEQTPEWRDFAQTAGRAHVHALVQEHMRGSLVERFQHLHANITGKPLRTTTRPHSNGELLLKLGDPKLFQELQAKVAAEQDDLRVRDESGRYAEMGGADALKRMYRDMQQRAEAAALAQGSMFSGTPDTQRAPQPIAHFERLALPTHIENRLAGMVNAVSQPIQPDMNPVHLIPDVTMGAGTKFAKQQRAVKMAVAGKKTAAFLGVGSGKTSVGIGAFTELHARGKARKGFYVVPSIVRNQFGEEMARMTEPGKYNWAAGEASFEERVQNYRDAGTHMVAVTHQAFRDDMIRLIASAHGYDAPDEAADAFLAASPKERRGMLKKALDEHQIPLDFLMMDEAHDSLDRAGKAESLLTAVTQAAGDLSQYALLATGTPIKNDASEVHSWLQKLDPARFADRDEFMRKYGADAHASSEALKRLMARYAYVDVVPSGSSKSITWGAEDGGGRESPSGHQRIALTPTQRTSLAHVQDAYEAARRARQNGRVDANALKILSPRSFEGRSPERQQEVAKRLNGALGALRHAAESRVINEAPAHENAKAQHVLALASQYKGKGGVVFAHNRESVRLLHRALEEAGHKVAVITGSDSAQDKARARERFKRGEVDILVASDAAATGANFQHRGQWLINYDLPLTHKTLEQRNARIDRLGQTRHIQLHHLITDADHDQDNYERLERKRALGSILQGEHESLDDTGIAKYLAVAKEGRPPKEPEPAEDQGGMFG